MKPRAESFPGGADYLLKNALLRAQMEVSPDGILVVDSRGRMVSFNRRFVAMWGIPDKVARSRSDKKAIRSVLDKLVDPAGFLARVRHLYAHPRKSSREELFLKDGRVFDRRSEPMFGHDGAHYGRSWFFRDISDRKQAEASLKESEEKFRLAFENARDAILWGDARTGIIVNCNQAAESLFGRPREEIIGLHQTSLHPPRLKDYYRKHFRSHVKAGTAQDDSMEIVTASGRVVPVGISAQSVRLGGQEVVQGIFRDLSAVTQANAERELLLAVSRIFREQDSIGAACGRICVEVSRKLGVTGCAIMQPAQDGRTAEYHAGKVLPAARTLTRLVLRSGKEVVVPDCRSRAGAVFSDARRLGLRTLLCIPVRSGEDILATVGVGDRTVRTDLARLAETLKGVCSGIAAEMRRKSAEQSLKESQQLYRALAEGIPDFVFLLDPDGRVLYANRKTPQMPEPVGKAQKELFPPKTARKHLEVIRKVVRTREPSLREEVVTWPGGRSVFENRLIPLHGPDGRVLRLLGLARDITQRKDAEESLRRSEERYRRVIETSQEGFGAIDLKGRVIAVSSQLENMFGYGPGELAGLDIVRDLVKPEDRQTMIAQIRTRRGGKPDVYEQRFRRKDGSTFWANVSGTPVKDGTGMMTGSFAMMSDITERKLAQEALKSSEHRLRALFRLSSDAIFIHRVGAGGEGRGAIVEANDSAIRKLGYSLKELRRMSPKDFDDPECPTDMSAVFARMRKKGHAIFEQVHVAKDGRRIPVEVSSRNFELEGRKMVFSIARDVSERKRVEAELRKMRAAVASSQEMERRRLSRELHDGVGQILSGIKFSLQSLPQDVATSPWDATQNILKAAGLLDKAIAEVRRVSQNLMPSELEDLGLQSALLTLCRGFRERSGVRTRASFSGVPKALDRDVSLALYRIAQEALTNIERHAGAREMDLAIRRRKDRLELTVFDDGIGCTTDRRRRRQKQGGLGLGNISERVGALGGRMDFDSEPGKGTRLTVAVPVGNGGR